MPESEGAQLPASPKFADVPLDELLVVEICAGSARLTKTFRKMGVRALAVDRTRERSCGTDIMVLDLTNANQLQLLLDILHAERDRLLLVFIAPPCGTASRARGRPIKTSLLNGKKAPVPLRTDAQPDGKDNLSGNDKVKTELANQLYDAIADIVLLLHQWDVCVVLENPKNSLYWLTSFALRFLSTIGGYTFDFHNCAHGGSRDKLTRFWSNKTWMAPLAILCDKSHQHESWRPRVENGKLVFPTAQEAAYPWLLCQRISSLAISKAVSLGAIEFQTLSQQMSTENFSKMNRYIFGALPRSAKIRPLVQEFSHFSFVVTSAQHVDYSEQVLAAFCKGAKITSRSLWQWGELRAEYGSEVFNFSFLGVKDSDLSVESQVELHQVGVPHDPLSFVKHAVEAGHPKDLRRFVGQAVRDVLYENFHQHPCILAKKRVEFLKKYFAAAKTIKVEELKLRLKMPTHIRKIMEGKRLALFGQMLRDLDFPDDNLIADISSGFKLSGWMRESHLFPKKVRSPTLTVEALLATTSSFNQLVRRQMQMKQDDQWEHDTWVETEAEIAQGWIWQDPSPSWEGKVVARRFGIRQGNKTRVIDDCTVCGLNLTTGVTEKFQLHTIDQLCCMLDTSLEMSEGNHCPVLGRTFDLKHAYKQFGLDSEDRKALRIAVQKPGQEEPILVGLNSLPFGAIGSVAGFLRISFAVWWIGLFGLGLAWTAYFDDFSTLTRPELENSTNWAVTSLFDLIGLEFAREGPKCPPFSPIFKMLGLTLDLARVSEKSFTIGHTSERKAELLQSLLDIAEAKCLTTKEAERLRGRLLFFESFVFGREANLTLKNFSNLCRMGRTASELTSKEVEVVLALHDRVKHAVPIPMGISNLQTWIIFTDGAVEGDVPTGSVGGVLVAPNHQIVHHFGGQCPDWLMAHLSAHSCHPIHEVEMIPVLLSFFIWGKLFGGAQVVHYIDNESVRLALLKGSGETPSAKRVAHSIMRCEQFYLTKSWYARVSSTSNISDGPSRGQYDMLETIGSTFCRLEWEELRATCFS